MVALSDGSFGLGAESTWGTPVTVTRWYEADSIEFDINRNFQQGTGLRVGSPFDRSDRFVAPTADATGTMGMICTTRGMGLLWEACLGTSVSTLVSGSTYQQNHTAITSTPNLPGRTIQTATVQTDGTVSAVTYEGCNVAEWTLAVDNAGWVTLETQWDAENWSTATGYTTPTYTASNNLYHFGFAAIAIGGAYTAPTTTALGSAATTVTNVRSFSLTGNNGLATDRFNLVGTGRKARQLAGRRTFTGTIEAEFDAATLRDLYLGDTASPMVLTLTSTEALSTGFAQLSVALPAVRFLGEIPKPNADGSPTVVSADFEVKFDGTNAPVTVSHRTADTAL